ncbi:hypothetical protein Phou_069650 [Phytohabitans houttuyneae]|uniref:FAD-binding domain-containing protein n=1 Tax=Phytohabitans houttuyneae TaxID=1076126 RepID=A0A6V8KQA2_9ACTN|nr:hypothetical protein Phou_069650 [Phytohabitans houttuyneae]
MLSFDVETDVLVVGSGPAGGAAALLLSTYGVANIVVTKYGRLADTPRAHITNQRTMEVLRDAGVEDQVVARATPQHLMGDTTFCSSLAGEELGRLRTWYTHPLRQAEHDLASPSRICDMPQHLMEPVLVENAVARGTSLRYQTEYLSLEQDAAGVTATVRDRLRGDEYRIRAKYLIGADGGRSKVAEDIGLPMVGRMGVAGSINIVFEADLTRYTAHRPSTLYWVLQTGSDVGGIGMGLVRCVRPWHEWLIVWGYDIDGPPPDLTEEYARRIAHHLIGDDSVPVTIRSSSAWTVNHQYARVYHRAGSSAPATPCTGTRRRTGSAPTRPYRTRTTWRGSSSSCSTARPTRGCSTRTRASARRWAGRSSSGPTAASARPRASSRRSGCSPPATTRSCAATWTPASCPRRRRSGSGSSCARR